MGERTGWARRKCPPPWPLAIPCMLVLSLNGGLRVSRVGRPNIPAKPRNEEARVTLWTPWEQ